MIALDGVGPEILEHWRRDVDLGDHVGVTGEVITTKRGELTVRAESFVITSKSMRPLPDKHKGLTDPEARVRARYVDLIVRPEAREVAYTRTTVVRSVRDSLHARGFTEVETPMLQLIHGGANARPFETHINAYDLDLYLRIATELHLKRLIVGGMEKVFEIGRQFRNEGVDFKHNPEFTSLEVYETYGDYNTMRVLTQEIIQEAATAVYGSPIARTPDADGKITEYDLSGDWPVKTICRAVSEALGEEITLDTPLRCCTSTPTGSGWSWSPTRRWGYLLEEIYGELCEGQTTTPVFYTDFPKENSPLARVHRDHPRLAEKWDLVIFGSEQGTAYSELIDPLEQRERLVAQSLRAAAGDPEAMQVDEDFLQALEYGMPPDRRHGSGHRPAGHEPHRTGNPRHDLVPAGPSQCLRTPPGDPRAEPLNGAARPVPQPRGGGREHEARLPVRGALAGHRRRGGSHPAPSWPTRPVGPLRVHRCSGRP